MLSSFAELSSVPAVPDKRQVADLSSAHISQMHTAELVEIIKILPAHVAPNLRFEFAGRITLERLAHLTRRYCQRLSC